MKTDLIEIFQTIRAVMQPYTAQGFNNRINSDDAYDLWSEKNVTVEGKERTEVCFASLEVREGAVVLYFMPVDTAEGRKAIFDPALLDLWKEDSGFEIRKLDDELLKNIENALAGGFRTYKEKDWV